MVWFEQSVRVDKQMASELNFALNIPTYGRIIACVVAVIGAVLLICVLISDYVDRKSRVRDLDATTMKNRVPPSVTETNEKLPEGSPLIQNKNIFKNISLTNQFDNSKKKKTKWSPENSTETSYIKN